MGLHLRRALEDAGCCTRPHAKPARRPLGPLQPVTCRSGPHLALFTAHAMARCTLHVARTLIASPRRHQGGLPASLALLQPERAGRLLQRRASAALALAYMPALDTGNRPVCCSLALAHPASHHRCHCHYIHSAPLHLTINRHRPSTVSKSLRCLPGPPSLASPRMVNQHPSMLTWHAREPSARPMSFASPFTRTCTRPSSSLSPSHTTAQTHLCSPAWSHTQPEC